MRSPLEFSHRPLLAATPMPSIGCRVEHRTRQRSEAQCVLWPSPCTGGANGIHASAPHTVPLAVHACRPPVSPYQRSSSSLALRQTKSHTSLPLRSHDAEAGQFRHGACPARVAHTRMQPKPATLMARGGEKPNCIRMVSLRGVSPCFSHCAVCCSFPGHLPQSRAGSSSVSRRLTASPPAGLAEQVPLISPMAAAVAASHSDVAAAASNVAHLSSSPGPSHKISRPPELMLSPSPSPSPAAPLLSGSSAAAPWWSSLISSAVAAPWSSLHRVVAGSALFGVSMALSSLGNTWATAVGRRLVLSRSVAAAAAAAVSPSSSSVAAAVSAPAVFDWGRSVLPNLDECYWLPDLMLLPMFVALVWMIAVQPPPPPAPAPSPSAVLKSAAATGAASTPALRFLWVTCMYSSLLSLRTASVCMTILGASPRCQAQSALLSADNAGFALNSGCFDLMFSGHSSFSVFVGSLAVVSRGFSVPSKVILVTLALLSAICNVAVGDHYSSDVWIGSYVGASVVAICRAKIREVF